MRQVTYEQYIQHIGYAVYKYRHSYSFKQHTTDLYGPDGIVAKVVRGLETRYYIF